MLLSLPGKRNPSSFFTPRHFSASAIQNLVSSFTSSPSSPDAVLRYLHRQGFSDPDIHTITTARPAILRTSPDKTLDPNLRALRATGLSPSALTTILLAHPAALQHPTAPPRINFWLDFFGGNQTSLLKAVKSNPNLLDYHVKRIIARNISLLQSHGLSVPDIRRIVLTVSHFIRSSEVMIEKVMTRAKELGFRTGSGKFVTVLNVLVRNKGDLLETKIEILKRCGWSGDDFLSALHKAPGIVKISETHLKSKMDFLVEEAGCDPSYIASHPKLLVFDLEKRLRPRRRVLHILEAKGLFVRGGGFYDAISLSDQVFEEKFLLPHKEEIPELHEAYTSGSR